MAGLVTTGLLAFIAAWKRVPVRLTFTSSNETPDGAEWPSRCCRAPASMKSPGARSWPPRSFVTVPLVGLVLVFQRMIVQGLTAGGVKG